jgi:branched-chain amino acid transport system ATP-binding protein
LSEPVLRVADLVVRYGAAVALDGVSLEIDKGEMVALVGPNGAGKSTLLNAVSGILRVASGEIELHGHAAQAPEGRQLFGELSVEDNLRVGAWLAKERDPAAIYRLFPELGELRKRQAGTLSGGEQQMVAIGRAIMGRPDLLMVDELSLGLAPLVVQRLAEHLRALNEGGTAIFLVEQNARLALDLCPRGYVLEAGRIVLAGPSVELVQSAAVKAAYLGGAADPEPDGSAAERGEELH